MDNKRNNNNRDNNSNNIMQSDNKNKHRSRMGETGTGIDNLPLSYRIVKMLERLAKEHNKTYEEFINEIYKDEN